MKRRIFSIVLAALVIYSSQAFAGSCATEGKQFSSIYKNRYPEHCCAGLTEWQAGMDTRISIADKCYKTGMASGFPVGICINCGNGICERNETVCNCPQDCHDGEHSTYQTVESFCKDQSVQGGAKCKAVIKQRRREEIQGADGTVVFQSGDDMCAVCEQYFKNEGGKR